VDVGNCFQSHVLHDFAISNTTLGSIAHSSLASTLLIVGDLAIGMSASILIDPAQDGEESKASTIVSPEGRKGSTEQPSPPEERLRSFRSNPTHAIQDRIQRAQEQTMFLISKDDDEPDRELKWTFVVLGSTGNVYDVTIQRVPHCTCPDHAKGNLCKHILFVLLKVMRVPSTSPLIYQQAWIRSELEEMMEGMRIRFQQVSGVMANAAVQKSYKTMKGVDMDAPSQNDAEEDKKVCARDEEEDCPICFDPLSSSASTRCSSHCGTSFHQTCVQQWKKQQCRTPTCPICRGSWAEGMDFNGSASWQSNKVYINLGGLQGQPPDRDTSTYHPRWDGDHSYGTKRRRRH
jgi:Ring finger domain/SWIM zinc finger